jgi:hypothetical protein
MYHEAVRKYALSLLGQVNKKTYESLAQILALPSHRHARKLKKKLVNAEGVAIDGPHRRMNRQLREVAIKNKWMKKYGFLDIILSFDSMVMHGSMILSMAASTHNCLIGVDLSQGHSAIESELKAAVLKLHKATATEEECETSMAEQLPLNKEHMVFYARAVKPGISLCFICAAYNLMTIVAADVWNQVKEVMHALIEENFNVRFITGDIASSNASYFWDESNIQASSFIPKDVLESFGLEGDYLIAFRHSVTKKIVFVIADPPHCLKQVGAALKKTVIWSLRTSAEEIYAS